MVRQNYVRIPIINIVFFAYVDNSNTQNMPLQFYLSIFRLNLLYGTMNIVNITIGILFVSVSALFVHLLMIAVEL